MTSEQIVGWQRKLVDGRVEIFVKAPELKIRAHGTPKDMNDLLDWFESKIGCAVNTPWRERRGPTPIRGQMNLVDDTYVEATG